MLNRLSVAIAATCLFGTAAIAQTASPAPTDAQIAHIAYTAGALDVDVAKNALTKTRTKAVRDFAQQMIRDHEAVNKQALQLVAKIKVTPADNPTSQALTSQINQEKARLAALDGAAFDKEYMNHEVAFHKTVNDALTSTLIPSAQNPELKRFLQTGLALFKGHQMHAEQIAATLK